MKTVDLSMWKGKKIPLGQHYRYIFQCPRCDMVSCFDGYGRIAKDATFEQSCDCGIGIHELKEQRKLPE